MFIIKRKIILPPRVFFCNPSVTNKTGKSWRHFIHTVRHWTGNDRCNEGEVLRWLTILASGTVSTAEDCCSGYRQTHLVKPCSCLPDARQTLQRHPRKLGSSTKTVFKGFGGFRGIRRWQRGRGREKTGKWAWNRAQIRAIKKPVFRQAGIFGGVWIRIVNIL